MQSFLLTPVKLIYARASKACNSLIGRPSSQQLQLRAIHRTLRRKIAKLKTIQKNNRQSLCKNDVKIRKEQQIAIIKLEAIQELLIQNVASETTLANVNYSALKDRLDDLSVSLSAAIGMIARLDIKLKQGSVSETNSIKDLNYLREIGDLRGFASKVFSQNGEDGIILEIFRRIKTENKFFVEFGVETGEQCNTRYLAECHNWKGIYFEPSDSHYENLARRWENNPNILTVKEAVNSCNFEQLLGDTKVPIDLDLLVIDIDGNDYWVWKALSTWRPRVVVIEYNAFHAPPKLWVMEENINHSWDQTTYFGASFASLCRLGKEKDYQLVAAEPMGVNMFFVRNDCLTDDFIDPSVYFYQPFGYLRPPNRLGPYREI